MLFILSSRFLPTSFSLLVTFTPLTHSFALYFKYHSNKPSFLILYFLIFFFICFFVYVTFSPTLFLINYVFSLLHTLFRFSLLFFLLYHSSFFPTLSTTLLFLRLPIALLRSFYSLYQFPSSYSLHHIPFLPTLSPTLLFLLLPHSSFFLLCITLCTSSDSLYHFHFLPTLSSFLPTLYHSLPFFLIFLTVFFSSSSLSHSSFLFTLSPLFFLPTLSLFLSYYSLTLPFFPILSPTLTFFLLFPPLILKTIFPLIIQLPKFSSIFSFLFVL